MLQESWQYHRSPKDVADPTELTEKRRAMKAATAVASSGRSQMESSRAVAETPTQIRWQISQEWMSKEKRDESRSSKAQNTRRRIAPNTSIEESKGDERTVAVTKP